MSEPEYYLARDGQTFGPYSVSAFPEMIQSGTISATDQICEAGTEDWHLVTEVFDMSAHPAVPPEQPAAATKVPAARMPQVTEQMIEVLDKRYRSKMVATILCLMLAVMPLLAKLDSKGRSEARMLNEDARGRDSGKKALAIILSKWWPVTMVIGGAGVVFFIRQGMRYRKDLKIAEKQFKAQNAGGKSTGRAR